MARSVSPASSNNGANRKFNFNEPSSKSLKQTVTDFLSKHKIVDSLPENAHIIVVNHNLTLAQCIEAMVCEQSASFSLIWDNHIRGFTGIVTLRNILELIVNICETIEQVHQECHEANQVLDVNQIIEAFLRDDHDELSEAVSDDDLNDMECGMDSSSGKNTHFRQRFPSTDTGDPSITPKQLLGDY